MDINTIDNYLMTLESLKIPEIVGPIMYETHTLTKDDMIVTEGIGQKVGQFIAWVKKTLTKIWEWYKNNIKIFFDGSTIQLFSAFNKIETFVNNWEKKISDDAGTSTVIVGMYNTDPDKALDSLDKKLNVDIKKMYKSIEDLVSNATKKDYARLITSKYKVLTKFYETVEKKIKQVEKELSIEKELSDNSKEYVVGLLNITNNAQIAIVRALYMSSIKYHKNDDKFEDGIEMDVPPDKKGPIDEEEISFGWGT